MIRSRFSPSVLRAPRRPRPSLYPSSSHVSPRPRTPKAHRVGASERADGILQGLQRDLERGRLQPRARDSPSARNHPQQLQHQARAPGREVPRLHVPSRECAAREQEAVEAGEDTPPPQGERHRGLDASRVSCSRVSFLRAHAAVFSRSFSSPSPQPPPAVAPMDSDEQCGLRVLLLLNPARGARVSCPPFLKLSSEARLVVYLSSSRIFFSCFCSCLCLCEALIGRAVVIATGPRVTEFWKMFFNSPCLSSGVTAVRLPVAPSRMSHGDAGDSRRKTNDGHVEERRWRRAGARISYRGRPGRAVHHLHVDRGSPLSRAGTLSAIFLTNHLPFLPLPSPPLP